MKFIQTICFVLIFLTPFIYAQKPVFTEIDAQLPDLYDEGDVAWADFDNDGDLDFAIIGSEVSGSDYGQIYRNDGNNTFTLFWQKTNITGQIDWGDYNLDGKLDLLMGGLLYRNDNTTFVETGGFTSSDADVHFIDYDNDGDLDIHISKSGIYDNNAGTFVYNNSVSQTIKLGPYASWADYNNDGFKDLIVIVGGFEMHLYRNDNGSFTDWGFDFDATDYGQNPGYPYNGFLFADIDWGDYDNDGDLDFIVCGEARVEDAGTEGKITVMYRNDGQHPVLENEWIFTQTETERFWSNRMYEGVKLGSVDWADFNNDGMRDFLLSGLQDYSLFASDYVTFLYYNDGTDIFSTDGQTQVSIRGMGFSSAAVGDYDNDGDLDYVQYGYSGSDGLEYATRIYNNNAATLTQNNAPAAPTNLQSIVSGDTIMLFWDASTDDHTPSAGLTYNVYVGTVTGVQDLVPAHAFSNGKLKIPTRGNAEQANFFMLINPDEGKNFYWSVQAIDAGFRSSPFAQEAAINTSPPSIMPISPKGSEMLIGGEPFPIKWNSNNVQNVRIEYSDDNGATWNLIADNLPSLADTNKYNWIVPEIESNQAKIKISNVADLVNNFEESATFSIIPRWVAIISPNGGESYGVNQQVTVDWTAPYESNFRLEYSTNGGGAWSLIKDINGSSGNSSNSWTIPNEISDQCLVRVSDLINTSVSDASDSFFAITGSSSSILPISPKGTEELIGGELYAIKWSSVNVQNVRIEYSVNNGASWILVADNQPSLADTNVYNWTVPETESDQAKLKFSNMADLDNNFVETSVFHIISRWVKIISPNGGESYAVDQQVTVDWTAPYESNFRLEYSTDGGGAWTLIKDINESSGNSSDSWTIPNEISDQCLVRVSDLINTSVSDTSDSFFAITTSSFSILPIKPIGSEVLIGGEPYDIKWSSENVQNVRIENSLDNGASWILVADNLSSLADTNIYNWTVPETESDQAKLKISNMDDLDNNFVETGVFSIIPRWVKVISPNGEEIYSVSQTILVSWTAPYESNFRLEYSTNGGGAWSLIKDINESSGNSSDSWTIPNEISDQCLVRVSDLTNAGISDTSDSFFTITEQDETGPEFLDIDIESTRSIGVADTIAVKVTDATGLGAVYMHYKIAGEAFYIPVEMIYDMANAEYVAIIPGNLQNDKGIQLYFEAIDLFENKTISDVYSIAVTVNNIENPIALQAGSSIDDYNLFSVPLILMDNTIESFLNNIGLSEFPDNEWFRLYAFENGSDDGFIEYDGTPGFPDIVPGHAFFLIADDSDVDMKSGSGKTVDVADEYEITDLASGWNLIGSPFNFPVPFDSIYVYSNQLSLDVNFDLWEWNPASGQWNYVDSGNLQPWKGYALYIDDALSNLSLYIPPYPAVDGGNPKFSTNNNNADEWMIQVEALTQEAKSSFHYIGQLKSAKDTKDSWDLVSPPRIGKNPVIYFSNDNNHTLATDLRKMNDYGHLWEFSALTKNKGEVLTLNFKGFEKIRSDLKLLLLDKSTSATYDIREQNLLKFFSNNMENRFQFIAGSEGFINNELDFSLNTLPEKLELHQNFPNPFNPSTQITFSIPSATEVRLSVHDILGKKLQVLVNRYMDPGNYNIVWEASNLSTGIYFVKLQAGKKIMIKKAMLMK